MWTLFSICCGLISGFFHVLTLLGPLSPLKVAFNINNTEGTIGEMKKMNTKLKLLIAVFVNLTILFSGSVMAGGNNGITLDQAMAVVAAAQAKAEKQGTLMDIAVVDAGANLTAFVRMDGAFLGSIDISIKKAKTARFFNMPTGKLGELAQPGQPLFNIEFSNNGLITFPGGLPLKDKNGDIIGAIGVSGSSVEDDHEVASAGAAVLIK